ncbi:MAG: RNA polymerase sigma factor [Chloroflexi bacterium]|nr:MAG: RNA polymerase sigma factor [Chloroflexota bacterium]TME15304.1 MAG: RNA polymerase sigma factor [Chloroflexota bacterium]
MEVSAIAAEQDLRQAAAGDTSAFELLLAPLLDPAYRLATVMLGDRGAAEDAVQEASVKAWRKLGGFRGAAPELQAWFFSIVANECRMTRRRRWWSVFKFADLPRSETPTADERFESLDIRQAIQRLPADDRLALYLFFYLDLPLERVARVLGVSTNGARSRVYRAARRLRPGLAPEEIPNG